MGVYDHIKEVTDRDSFVEFLNALAQDCKENHDEWQNGSIEDYLMSIAAWIKEWSDLHGDVEFAQLDFNKLAKMFYVGKIYE